MTLSPNDWPLIREVRHLVAADTCCNTAECDELRGPDVYCGCERLAIELIEKIRSNAEIVEK